MSKVQKYRLGSVMFENCDDGDYRGVLSTGSLFLDEQQLVELGAKPVEPDEVELEELPVSHGLEPENADKHDIVYNRSSIIELQEKVNVIIQQLNSLKSRIKEVEDAQS